MARLNNIWDNERLSAVRAAQDDPMVQYIITRRSTTKSLADLATDAAMCLRAATHFADNPVWKDYYATWLSQSFRKICLRARDGQWNDLLANFDHEVVGDAIVLPPRPRSQREDLLGRMNALTRITNDEPLPTFSHPVSDVTIIVNTDLGMSAGKTIAQVGHGALRDPNTGSSVSVVGATTTQFDDIAARYDVWSVQDAGFTEIAPGSETVLVLARP